MSDIPKIIGNRRQSTANAPIQSPCKDCQSFCPGEDECEFAKDYDCPGKEGCPFNPTVCPGPEKCEQIIEYRKLTTGDPEEDVLSLGEWGRIARQEGYRSFREMVCIIFNELSFDASATAKRIGCETEQVETMIELTQELLLKDNELEQRGLF